MKSKRKIASRLLLREYLPFATALVTWLVVAAACSKSCAVILLAAWTLAGAARALFTVNVRGPIRRALSAGGRIERAAWARLWALEGAAAFLAVSTTGAFAFWARHTELAIVSAPLFIIGLSLPARYIGPLAASVRARGGNIGIAVATRQVSGAVLAALLAVYGSGIIGFAMVLAAREWIGAGTLLLMYRLIPERGGASEPPVEDTFDLLHWGTIAAATGRTGQRRFSYRLLKMVLSSLMGPLGTALARTARGTKLLRNVEFGSRTARWVLAAVIASGLAGVAYSYVLQHPVARLALLSVSIRLAAVAASALFWLRFSARQVDDAIDPESEQDDDLD